MLSPGNRLATNPVVPRRIFEQGGANLVRGALNVLGDLERTLTGTRVAGRDVAVTLRVVGEYRVGDRAPMSDLMARNAGATRLPARMHSQYPRRLLLDNDRSEGRYPVGGRRQAGGPERHRLARVHGRHRHRPRRALALDLQAASPDRS